MTETPETAAPKTGRGGRQIPPIKLWIFFALFLTVAVSLYAGTWYRIRHDGFMGTGNDQLAHPKAATPETGTAK